MPGLDDLQHDRFLRLFTAHEPAVRAYVRRLVPSRDDAREVMQEIALVLWRKFAQVAKDEDFGPWAFGVARFEALAWLRDRARDRLTLSAEVLELVADESGRAEERLAAQREALEDCLRKLPEQQQGLVRAAYAGGARIQELAAESGRTVAGFYQWLHRIRLALLECTRRKMHEEAGT
jgi:RNA polymerase sigma-70 factor (ECF subfamily)